MVYVSSVEFYDELTSEMASEYGFIYGDTFADAMSTLNEYYGESSVEKISLEVFAPDNYLIIGDKEVFDKLKEKFKEGVLW